MNTLEQAAMPRMSAFAVLGFSNQGDAEWTRLRSLQFSALEGLTLRRMLAHCLMAFLTVSFFADNVSPIAIGIWCAALVVVNIHGGLIDRSLADAYQRSVSPSEFHSQTLTSVASGILWSVPLLLFVPMASNLELIAILLIMAMLTMGSIQFYSAAPASVICFASIVGLSITSYFAFMQMWPLAGIGLLFTLIAVFGAVEVGRAYLMMRITESNLGEKEEVVSLLLREFEENEADWLWEVDTQRRLRSVSPRFAYALGCQQSEAEHKSMLEMISSQSCDPNNYPASLCELSEKLKNRENFSNLLVQVTLKGEERWWELSGTPIRDERGKFTGFRGVGSDVTAQRVSSEKIAYLARYDTLTNLPNRMQINEALGEALRTAESCRSRCALLMLDLDRFKAVNDSLGHIVGDKLLERVSQRLKGIVGDHILCGRLGGDEFAIVISDASNLQIIEHTARQIIETLSEPYHVDHHTLYVGVSVGSAIGPRDGRTVEELMRNADLALYRAKDIGGGEHYQFEPKLHATAEERRQLEVSLRNAVLEDEFVLHYQPVVNARSEDVISFEALVRWNSPAHGFVSPGKFIPLAEDTRLIVPIGRWVLRRACMEALSWPSNVKVNVNVSPEQLLEPDFYQEVIDALAQSGLRAERLEVEVTESIFLRDPTIARSTLEKIMALGCSVALDDFGTGYSSLGYLRELRFSTIKVDRTFVQGAAQGANESLAIINAVVAMAKSLNMTTTAEGVETLEELELIRTLGCDKIQGFYFGRPMSEEEARRLFLTQTRRLQAG